MNLIKFMVILSSLVLFLTTTGCLTKRFYESDHAQRTYHEKVDSFLITEDGSTLVVLGEKYHYIFEASPNLKKVLLGSFRPMVVAHFPDFYVTTDNKITGNYTLYLDKDAPEEQRKSAIEAGFIDNNKSDLSFFAHISELSLSGHLEGTRYSAEGFPVIAQKYKFNIPYYVDITEEQSATKLAGKILITPILVLADGVLILGGAALMLFMRGCGGCG